jgi:hypothetical protein
MEHRIKEQQLLLFADRTSTGWLRSNQWRLWFRALTYVLVQKVRRGRDWRRRRAVRSGSGCSRLG